MSPRRDAVPDDARVTPCLPSRPMALEHARQIGTRESFGPGMTLAAAALTTDGSESLAMDTTGIVILLRASRSPNPERTP